MNLKDIFIYLGFQGTYTDQCKQYAQVLGKQKGIPRAEDLQGDEYSKNGLCVWHKEKAFLNKYNHEIDFETISRVFEDPPPPGFEILRDIPDPSSLGENDRVFVQIQKDNYLIIKTNAEGDLIRLISAILVTKARMRKELSQRLIVSSDLLWVSLAGYYDDDGYERKVYSNKGVIDKFFELESLYCEGKVNEDFMIFVLIYGFGLSEDHAEKFLVSWNHRKCQTDKLAGMM